MKIDEQFWQEYREMVRRSASLVSEYERLDNMTKVIKSQLMMGSSEKSIAAQERDAYAHDSYSRHLGFVADARKAAEWAKGEVRLLSEKLECWRTMRADRRAEMNLR